MKILLGLLFFQISLFGSVVIVGGGPAGLATAIEAKMAGADVTVVEKKITYERFQRLFLFEHSMELLRKWGVECPELVKMGQVGIVRISALEEALLVSAKKLGVQIVQDRFILDQSTIPYTTLVVADGAHSQVREALGINLDRISQGKAGSALIPSQDEAVDVSADIQHGTSFIKKFYFPGMNFMFIQGITATEEDFIRLCRASGWNNQADQIALGNAKLLLNIDVYLQKAKKFALPDQKVLLVGDAAATGTFFRGSGANFALKTAEIAGKFFRSFDYVNFELEMEKEATALIEDSAYLFQK